MIERLELISMVLAISGILFWCVALLSAVLSLLIETGVCGWAALIGTALFILALMVWCVSMILTLFDL